MVLAKYAAVPGSEPAEERSSGAEAGPQGLQEAGPNMISKGAKGRASFSCRVSRRVPKKHPSPHLDYYFYNALKMVLVSHHLIQAKYTVEQ